MSVVQHLINDLKSLGSPKKAKASAWFFKTGKGQYGEGDLFYGVTVPEQRVLAKKYFDLKISDIQKLLNNKFHECRLTGLMILVLQYEKADIKSKKKIVSFYLKNSKKVNNWDLVDSSAPYILGDHLLKNNREILHKYSQSKNIWQRRIAIVSTLALIRDGDFKTTLEVSKLLFGDREDLIHKATGWMLREVGKKSEKTLDVFILKYAKLMPRTTLRYAIERFNLEKRRKYLKL